MGLSVYDVIKKVMITEKSTDLFKRLGKLTFQVHIDANKVMIREAVEKIWDVKVDNVRIVNIPGKLRVFARNFFKTPDRKKAIVTLKKGYKIDLPQFETMGVKETMGGEKKMKIEEK